MRRLTDEETVPKMLAAKAMPLEPYPGSNKSWKCQCLLCGEIILPRYLNVMQGHRACAYCADRKVNEKDAVELMRNNRLEPKQPFPGSHLPWLCCCLTCGKEVIPKYNAVQQGQGGCIFCGIVKRADTQRLPEQRAIDLLRKNGAEPLEPYPGSNLRWKCQCAACNNIIYPRYSDIKQGVGACCYCGHCAVNPSDAIDLMYSRDLKPLELYPGSDKPWKCQCLKCNSIVWPRYHGIKNGQGGCLPCGAAQRGLGSTDAAVIYLISHQNYRAIKIGIGAAHQGRVKQHEKHGWNTVHVWSGIDGVTAYTVERMVLDTWRTAGIPTAVSRSAMPQGGFTETAPMGLVDLVKTRRLITRTINAMALRNGETGK